MSDELLPCPFCGCHVTIKNIFWKIWQVRCSECPAEISTNGEADKARDAWNRRAPKAVQP